MLLLLAAAMAAPHPETDPVLAASGWTWLGPLPPGRDPARGDVVFDAATCAVEVAHTDLDGGPENRDVRLARVWTEGAWRWADDWRVEGGQLLRPGRTPVPLDGARLGETVLRMDTAGRVTGRTAAGRTVEVLRDDAGAFVGMRSGTVEVRVDADRGVASDGREVRWRRDAGMLTSVADAGGVRVVYGYSGGALTRLSWADGGALAIEGSAATTRTSGVGGTWRCEVRGDGRVRVEAPVGTWIVEPRGGVQAVTDPTGSTTRARWEGGRLVGWTDPRGGETRLTRDARGRVTSVDDPTGAGWTFTWADTGLATVGGPDGATWTLGRDTRGALTRVDEPVGRYATFERDAAGRVRGVRVGAAEWTTARDGAGRVTAFTDPAGSRVDVVRGANGHVSRVRDGGGGVWTLGRDVRGHVTTITDPGGGAWSIDRDGLGRPVAATAPTGARTRWTVRDDGLPGRVVVAGRHAWELLWTAGGALSGVRDPAGRTTGWGRDALGRARALHRADGEVVRLDRDAAGDLVGVGEGVRVRRDAAGRAIAVEIDGRAGLAWDRDTAGRVVGVSAPGMAIAFAREPGGAVREVRVADSAPVRLARDGQGRVVRAEGDGVVTITRDAAGRVQGVARGDGAALTIARDVRGLEARLTLDGKPWTFGRDGAGRVVSVEGPGGVRLGVDRDVAGLPRLARFPTGALATLLRDADEVRVALADRDGRLEAEVGWTTGASGRLDRLHAGLTWLLRRDPLGALVAAEAEDIVWSSAPDGVEGPGGAFVRYDPTGRPVAARLPAGWGGAWGLGEGELRYELDAAGAITAVTGDAGRVVLAYDGAGRLVGWRGPAGEVRVRRDALGRLVGAGRTAVEGWNELLARDGVVRAGIPGVAAAERGGGVLCGPDGVPLLTVHGGLAEWAPQGGPATADVVTGGRFLLGLGTPPIGLLDALDPASGQPLGPGPRWPWATRAWEPTPDASPWPDPDAAATPAWDDAPWAPSSPWSDPLALLVATGDLPDGGSRASRAPGLPWLPGSLAPELPASVVDPFGLSPDEDPVVAWIIGMARAPTRAPEAHDLAALFLAPSVAPWLDLPPGLAPDRPAELGG